MHDESVWINDGASIVRFNRDLEHTNTVEDYGCYPLFGLWAYNDGKGSKIRTKLFITKTYFLHI